MCTLLSSCHPSTESPTSGGPSGTGGTTDNPTAPIRVFTPITLIYEGYCTLCKESFGVSGFNNRNDVIGSFTTGNIAVFLWSNGNLSTFWLRDSYYLFQHINDDGVIYGTAGGAPAKFVGLEPTPLDVMPTYVVNNLGHICGRVESQTVCYVGDQEKKLDVVFDSYAELSDNGLLVGTFEGKAQILDIATGASTRFEQNSRALSVNSAGQVVGDALDSGIMRPFVYYNNVLQFLDLAAGYKSAAATDINNRGEIVGEVTIDGMTGWHSSDNPTVGGVTGTTLFDFFYCNAAGACMRMPAGPEEYRGSLGRIRINDLGTVAFGGDSALTLFE